jgi:hypothetical protein
MNLADGWIIYPKSAVLLQAKSAKFSLSLGLSGDFGIFERTFRESILRAARQLSRTIDELRSGEFAVQGLRGTDLPRLLPVVVTLDYVPLDYFLSGYIDDILTAEGLLTQANIGRLTSSRLKISNTSKDDKQRCDLRGSGGDTGDEELLTLVSNVFTDLNLTDVWTCYKVFRREVIQNLTLRENRFGFEPEVTAGVARARCRVFEVPISYSGRTYSEGKKITWKDGARGLWCTVRYNVFR